MIYRLQDAAKRTFENVIALWLITLTLITSVMLLLLMWVLKECALGVIQPYLSFFECLKEKWLILRLKISRWCASKQIRSIKIKTRIFPADSDDVHKGWIRISEDLRKGLPSGAYVKVKSVKKHVYCQIRGKQGSTNHVEVNEWYRDALKLGEAPTEAELEVCIPRIQLLAKIRAWAYHPDDIIRTSIGLALIGVGLGLLSVVSASVDSVVKQLSQSLWWGAGLAIELLLVIIIMILLCQGLWTITRSFPK